MWISQWTGGLPIKCWAADPLDAGTREQTRNLSKHPVLKFHVALMPDAHSGYGMPIGGVIAADNALIPNAVGMDIGCGMISQNTSCRADEVSKVDLQRIVTALKKRIPMGFAHHEEDQPFPFAEDDIGTNCPIVREQWDRAKRQIGTLGGGNHFIEIQKNEEAMICLMLHSGSRNIGARIAKHYHNEAKTLCKRWRVDVPDDLAFLPIGERMTSRYIDSLNFALRFAKANRWAMMDVVRDVVHDQLGCVYGAELDVHHNFAAIENHFGRNVWIHRKGATQAYGGQEGIIPGSMGTKSFLVMGKGNRDSFDSCSHGAGRRMGRKQFTRTHTREEVDKQIEGVVFSGWTEGRNGDLDFSEAPGAYKDIDEVMALQKDLVEITSTLTPLASVKG